MEGTSHKIFHGPGNSLGLSAMRGISQRLSTKGDFPKISPMNQGNPWDYPQERDFPGTIHKRGTSQGLSTREGLPRDYPQERDFPGTIQKRGTSQGLSTREGLPRDYPHACPKRKDSSRFQFILYYTKGNDLLLQWVIKYGQEGCNGSLNMDRKDSSPMRKTEWYSSYGKVDELVAEVKPLYIPSMWWQEGLHGISKNFRVLNKTTWEVPRKSLWLWEVPVNSQELPRDIPLENWDFPSKLGIPREVPFVAGRVGSPRDFGLTGCIFAIKMKPKMVP
ncbi:hypothetical protein K435DRAFT_803599 [Dendrothele bispora CBS 962.96]|uniref:Uncharacterized protein n=1 Tax=Dendrothele bispora (strain CBS 962.96) TaxID=1314807 RepID=A0A4S8LH15_DENBC|nr:hypothetical protein K435DRAFT_803599 [Dendrothele bispora CBS 962.96]